jgi:hypothetical protein
MANEVKIKIGADVNEFNKGVAGVKKGFNDLNKTVVDFSKIAEGATASFIGNLSAKAVAKGFSLISDGFKSAISSAKEFANLAGIQEDAVNKLNVALAQGGNFTQARSKDFQDFASQLQNASRFGDELILKNAALIQSFGNLSNDGLKRATQAAADYAAGTGKSLDEASAIIAKASTGQVEALKRVGIQVERTGDQQKDFASALDAIEKRFGGSAIASINTYAGAQEQLGNTIGDVKERLGEVITQNPVFISALKGVNEAFKFLEKEVINNKEALANFVENGIDFFIKGIGFAGESINFFIDVGSGFKAFVAEITDLTLASGQTFVEFSKTVVDSSIAVTDFFGKTTEAQVQAQRSLEASSLAFQAARDINQERVAGEIADNESLKSSISSITERVQQEIQSRIDAEKESGEISKTQLLEQLNEQALIRQESSEAEKLFRAQFNEEFLAEQVNLLGRVTAEQNKFALERLAGEGKYNQALLELQKQRETAQRASFLGLVKYEDQTQRERINNLKGTFSQIASLQSSGSQTLFAIGKGAAIANATIDGIAATQKALASAPPPFNFALAALVGTAAAANVANIASSKPPTGAFDGALVDKGSMFSDSQPFMLSKGEVVAPRKDFDDVVEGTARQRGFVKQDEVSGAQSGAVSINISGDVIGDELFINNLIEKIRDAVQFRNADLGVS